MNKFKLGVIWFFGLLILLIALLSSVVSTGLSIAYFTDLTNDGALQLVVIGFIILLQSMVLIGSIVKSVIYKRCSQHYNKIVWFTNICFIISVLSTISFFNQFDKTQRIEVIKDLLNSVPVIELNNNNWLVNNLTNLTLIWLSCIVIDLMSMFFPTIGSDLISGISIKEKIQLDNIGYLTKVWKLITYYPKNWIDKKCQDFGIIEDKKDRTQTHDGDNLNIGQNKNVPELSGRENSGPGQITKIKTQDNNNKNKDKLLDKNPIQFTKDTGQLRTKNNTNIDMTTNPDSPQDVPIQTTKDLGQNEDVPSIKKDRTKTKKTEDKKPRQDKTNQGQNKTEDKKSGLEDVIKNIDEYIILNYKSKDLIKVGQLKTKFNIKDREWKDKIIYKLESAFVNNNKRLERKQIDSKDKFKIVK